MEPRLPDIRSPTAAAGGQRGTGVPDFLPDRLAVRPTTRPRCRTIQTDFKGTNACTAHKACENQQES